jgi:hypothetical protein
MKARVTVTVTENSIFCFLHNLGTDTFFRKATNSVKHIIVTLVLPHFFLSNLKNKCINNY